MKRFLVVAIVYFLMAVVIVLITRPNGLVTLWSAWYFTLGLAPVFGRIMLILATAGAIIAWKTQVKTVRSVILGALMAFFATLLFQSGFTLIKTSLPYAMPFYADAWLARWDALLHGGHDPWVFTHWIASFLPMEWIAPVYLNVWVWPAICLPVAIAAMDFDQKRAGRFLILYVMAWVLIGNVIALFGMSAGPVFYDRMHDADRFAALTAAIDLLPVFDGSFGGVQDHLWSAYSDDQQSIGAGISAFPSVHVSVAMVSALYLWERSNLLGLIGAVFVAVILFLSVYSGYHYALDGYFSMAFMWAAWALLLRRDHAGERSMGRVSMPERQLA